MSPKVGEYKPGAATESLMAALPPWYLEQSFLPRVKKYTRIEGECLIWIGAKNTDGYANLMVATGARSRLVVVHRALYFLAFGPLEEGNELDHACRKRACVSFFHMNPVDHATNVRLGMVGAPKSESWKRALSASAKRRFL